MKKIPADEIMKLPTDETVHLLLQIERSEKVIAFLLDDVSALFCVSSISLGGALWWSSRT